MNTRLPSLSEMVDNDALRGRVMHRAERGDRAARLLLDQLTNAWAEAVRDTDTDQTGGTAA